MDYYSHNEEREYYILSLHLANVAAGAAGRVQAAVKSDELINAAVLTGITHDFGKHTSFFQNYLRHGNKSYKSQHAFLSGIWANHLAFKFGIPLNLRLACFVAVIRHHQGLETPGEFLVPYDELYLKSWDSIHPTIRSRLNLLKEQMSDLSSSDCAVINSLTEAATETSTLLNDKNIPVPKWLSVDWKLVFDEFIEKWRESYGELFMYWHRLKREKAVDLNNYFIVLNIFSALIDADKIHAARAEDISRTIFSEEALLIGKYRAEKFNVLKSPMDEMREELFAAVTERLKKAPNAQKVFTITAPTGSGKTIAGLQAAILLRNSVHINSIPSRIIYALPFTSIIDQTFDVAKDVLKVGTNSGFIPSSWLMKHHHLAEISYKVSGDVESRPNDEALLLIESWQSEIVITTFVQLFQTLIGHENRLLKKFCRLNGAILVLDEVQNIPVEYWLLVEKTLRSACDLLNMKVILMTATRPCWFKDVSYELAGDSDEVRERFNRLNRVSINADLNQRTVDTLAADFLRSYRNDFSYLVELNTINSSIAFFNALKEEWGDCDTQVFYLSTNIVPIERGKRLRAIRELLEAGKKPVLVSTQVVEAGVDIDFDEVWRDLGPIDSVIQVAGRCNRSNLRVSGKVRVFQLVDKEGGRSLSSFVYGNIHTAEAREFFLQRKILEEHEFFDAVGVYFENLSRKKSSLESEQLLTAMTALRFTGDKTIKGETVVSDFKLIEDQYHYVQVFICIDTQAEEIWNDYQAKVANQRDLKKRMDAYLGIKQEFSKYVISVPKKILLHRLGAESVVPLYLIDQFYDNETGFKRVAENDVLIF